MPINKLLSYAVLITAGLLHLGGLSAVDLQTMAQRKSFKQKVLTDIKNGDWEAAANGIEQFERSNLKRFAIDLRKEFANTHSEPGTLPTNWPSSLQKIEERNRAKKIVKQALKDGNFAEALAGILKLQEAARRELYKTFVDTVVSLKDTKEVEIDEGYDDPDELFVAAAQDNNLPIMKKLFKERGAHINSINDRSVTALMWSANNGNQEITEFLLDNGADPDKQDLDSTTALIWASFRGHKPIVKLLLDANANANLKDRRLKTARDYASDAGHTEIVDMLETAMLKESI